MTTPGVVPAGFRPLTLKPFRTGTDARTRLSLSDYWLLAGCWLAMFYVADPFGLRLDLIGITKHLPLVLCLCGVVLANIGACIFPPREDAARHRKYWQVLTAALPLILLGAWIFFGSLFARKVEGIGNTFINVGLYMLITVFIARHTLLSPARASLVKAYLIGATLAGIFMAIRMLPLGWTPVNYHELEAMVTPLAVYFALRPGNRHWKAIWVLFFIMAGLVFQKNTGFLVLTLTLLYIWVVEWRFRFRESTGFRFWTLLWAVVIIVAGIAAYGYLAYQRGDIMPSGNPQYRLMTYEQAWLNFRESPIWGTGFTASAVKRFTVFDIAAARGILATHSDLLDMAAQGGLIALLLWLWSYIRIGRLSLRHVLRGRVKDDMHAAAHALACMAVTSVVVYAFNPILLQPVKAFLHWSAIGLLLGLTLHYARLATDDTAIRVVLGRKLKLIPYYKDRKNSEYRLANKYS